MRGLVVFAVIVVIAVVIAVGLEAIASALPGAASLPIPRPTPDRTLLTRWYTDRVNALSVARQYTGDYTFNSGIGRELTWINAVVGLGKSSERLDVLAQETTPAGVPLEVATRFNAVAGAYHTAMARYYEASKTEDRAQQAGSVTLGNAARNQAEGLAADWLRDAASWLNTPGR